MVDKIVLVLNLRALETRCIAIVGEELLPRIRHGATPSIVECEAPYAGGVAGAAVVDTTYYPRPSFSTNKASSNAGTPFPVQEIVV